MSTGDFISRVFDSSGAGAALRTLRWVPGAPYGKALPDRAMSETGYRASGFDMAKNVFLVHFDDGLVDTSPTANVLTGSALGGFVPAVFGSGLSDTPTGYVRTTVTSSQSVFDFGTDSFSWSIWAKSTTPCPGNAVYMGIENPGTGLKPHLWLGCTSIAADAAAQGTLGDTFCSTRGATNDCAEVNGLEARLRRSLEDAVEIRAQRRRRMPGLDDGHVMPRSVGQHARAGRVDRRRDREAPRGPPGNRARGARPVRRLGWRPMRRKQ